MYDFELEKIESVNISPDLKHLFENNVSVKVDNNFLYACSSHKIDTFQLSDMILINSLSIKLQYSPLSKHFINDYCILRFHDHIRFVHLKYGFSFKRNFINPQPEFSKCNMRTLDESKLIFFNRDTKKYFIST